VSSIPGCVSLTEGFWYSVKIGNRVGGRGELRSQVLTSAASLVCMTKGHRDGYSDGPSGIR
jgi:hypothetical protein